MPLLFFALGFLAFARAWRPGDARARFGLWVALGGLVLVFAGVALEFWGVLVQDAPTAHDAGSGEEAWAGSRVGPTLFVTGFFSLIVGGVTAAVALWRSARFPGWLSFFVGGLGWGVLLGNALREAPLPLTVPCFGAFAAGWLALAADLWRGRISPEHGVRPGFGRRSHGG